MQVKMYLNGAQGRTQGGGAWGAQAFPPPKLFWSISKGEKSKKNEGKNEKNR